MGWNYFSILKLQQCNRWSLGMDKLFHTTFYQSCHYLSMLGLKLNHVSKRGPRPGIESQWLCLQLTRFGLCQWKITSKIGTSSIILCLFHYRSPLEGDTWAVTSVLHNGNTSQADMDMWIYMLSHITRQVAITAFRLLISWFDVNFMPANSLKNFVI